ncbi:MAG: hypothetical protein ACE5J2_03260 [Nitrososphaerales archaeon]
MGHLGIDITTHLFLALYPAAAFFFIELGARFAKILPYRKYIIQGISAVAFAIAYLVVIDATGIAIMLLILGPILFAYARRVKENPTIR